jgi:acetate kinase
VRILAVNVGSSSVKVSVIDKHAVVSRVDRDSPNGQLDEDDVRRLLEGKEAVDAVAHRLVHGAALFSEPTLVDADVRRQLQSLVEFAPLHLPRSLAAIDLVNRIAPNLPSIACFDTAFHRHIPPSASTYAIPAEWRERWPIRRYGFHGLSHAWATARAAALVHRGVESLRIVSCHLGSGSSLAAVMGGVSIDTTMGFTPMEGLVMATRSGSIDPGLILWLETTNGITPAELAQKLEHESGLLGLAGSDDMKELLSRETQGDSKASLAVGVFLHRLQGQIAAMAAAMGGLDVLTFAGGIGEHAPSIRARAVSRLRFLGVALDEGVNAETTGDGEISHADSEVRTFVIMAQEDVQMALDVEAMGS